MIIGVGMDAEQITGNVLKKISHRNPRVLAATARINGRPGRSKVPKVLAVKERVFGNPSVGGRAAYPVLDKTRRVTGEPLKG